MLEELLDNLSLSSDEVKVYCTLLEKGPQTAGRLAQMLGFVRPTLYNMLNAMVEKGVVERGAKKGVQVFGAESPQALKILFHQRLEFMQKQYKKFEEVVPLLEQKASARMLTPRIQFYEGREGVQNMMNDVLLYSDLDTFSFWPIKSMLAALTPEFLHWHNKERIRRNTHIRAIWPEAEAVNMKDFPFMGMGKEYLREIRMAPTEVQFTLGYWAYGNKVLFLSSQEECFGYTIESAEMVIMQHAQHKVVWGLSKPLTARKEDLQPFIDELN